MITLGVSYRDESNALVTTNILKQSIAHRYLLKLWTRKLHLIFNEGDNTKKFLKQPASAVAIIKSEQSQLRYLRVH